MSPEQIEGKELDARSDIFSLGAVLYEMLTGQRAFEGKSQLSVASAILEKEPAPISAIKPLAPRSLDHVIRRCLAKAPDDRWQTARDVALELSSVAQGDAATQQIAALTLSKQRNLREWMAWGLLGVVLLLSATHFFFRSRASNEPSQQLVRAAILAPEGHRITWEHNPVISPDGHSLAFEAAAPDGERQLWVRPLDSLAARPLPGTEGAYSPFWSPDSRWIAFFVGWKMKRISVDGGAPLEICDASSGRGGSWGKDGTIVFGPGIGLPLYSVPETGGTPKQVTHLDSSLQERNHRWPQFLPDGRHFLFFSQGSEYAVYVGSVDSTDRKLILKNDSNAVYAPPGYLLFVRNGILLARPFDAARFELSGKELPIAEGVPAGGALRQGLFSVSANGILSIQAKVGQLVQPAWVDRAGKVLEVVGEPSAYSELALSPNGQSVAFTIRDPKEGSGNIWLYSATGKQRTRLTYESVIARWPVWSPDGKRIIFFASSRIFCVPTSGTGQAEPFVPAVQSDERDYPSSWSPDGKYVALARYSAAEPGFQHIWIFPTSGDPKPYRLFNIKQFECCAIFSPDGKWLAYLSAESGRGELYVAPFPDANSKIPVSTAGFGGFARWSPDGRGLYYNAPDGTLMCATLQPGKNGLQVSSTESLFKLTSDQFHDFAVSHDGKRFLVFKDAENQPPSAITIITNWTKALPR